MHYKAGDRVDFLPEMINFKKNKRFILRRAATEKIKSGCPLMVIFSNYTRYAIGMFES